MAVNKVTLGDETLVDLTSDTVDAAHLLSGYTAHDASGSAVTGSYSPPAAMTLPTSTSSTAVGTRRAIIPASTSNRYLNIPVGYNSAAANYLISGIWLDSATFTSNGTYQYDGDGDGWNSVTVNVSGGGLNDFIVTLTEDGNGVFQPDCTWSELMTARSTKNVVFTTGDPMMGCSWDYDGPNSKVTYTVYIPGDTGSYEEVFAVNHEWTSSGVTMVGYGEYPDTSVATAVAADVASGKTFFGASGYGTGTASGGGGGGASNVVTGSFTGTTTGAAMDVTLSYSGSGYPVACLVWVDGGVAGNTTFANAIQRYAVAFFSMAKAYEGTAPTYATSGNANQGATTARYKSSASSATSYSNSSSHTSPTYSSSNASAASNTVLKFKSATTMSVFIASTSYGFMANVKYNYVVVYSS